MKATPPAKRTSKKGKSNLPPEAEEALAPLPPTQSDPTAPAAATIGKGKPRNPLPRAPNADEARGQGDGDRETRKEPDPLPAVASAKPSPSEAKPSEYRLIALNLLFPSPTNPRKHFDPDETAELAASIREHGVIEPIIIRPAQGQFEVVAGERRYRAAVLAEQEEIPAIIRSLTDTQVLEIQIIENNQRSDIRPLEECDGFHALIATGIYGSGHTAAEALAEKIGRSVRYVYNRLKLKELSPENRAMVADGKLTASHAEILSRLTPESQQEVKGYLHNYQGDLISVRRFDELVRNQILRQVDTFIFDIDEATLCPSAGACTRCEKNTAVQTLLFPDAQEGKKGSCTDPACYNLKIAAFLARQREQVTEATGTAPVEVSSNYSPPTGALSTEQYSESKETVKGAQLALVVDGPSAGRTIFIKPTEAHKTGRGIQSKSESQLKQEREAKINTEFRSQVLDHACGFLEGWQCLTSPPVDSLLRFLAHDLISRGNIERYRKLAAHYECTFEMKGDDAKRALRDLANHSEGIYLAVLLAKLLFTDRGDYSYNGEVTFKDLARLAAELGVDLDHIRKEAEQKFAPKKSKAS